jgi:hypothetical protein
VTAPLARLAGAPNHPVEPDPGPFLLGIPGLTAVGLALPQDLSFELWDRIGVLLRLSGNSLLWAVGDWYLHGEVLFGEKASQARAIGEASGFSPRTVQEAARVSERFDFSRRLGTVSWTVHQALAGVRDADQRLGMLEEADRESWTLHRAREALRALRSLPAPERGSVCASCGRRVLYCDGAR